MAPPFFVRRVWILFADHSTVGVYWTREAAREAKKVWSELRDDLYVVGPYVLTKSAMRKWAPK